MPGLEKRWVRAPSVPLGWSSERKAGEGPRRSWLGGDPLPVSRVEFIVRTKGPRGSPIRTWPMRLVRFEP